MAIHNTTHDLWRFFWHSIQLQKKSPLIHRYPTHELEEPYRRSNSLILRLPWSHRGLVMGLWRSTGRTEQETLMDAMEGRQMTDDEFMSAEKAHIRRSMIKKQFTADQQALVIDALDL